MIHALCKRLTNAHSPAAAAAAAVRSSPARGFRTTARYAAALPSRYVDAHPMIEQEEPLPPPSPSPKVLKIVDDIAGLTLLEASDMSLLLRKKLRLPHLPVVSVGMNVMHDMLIDSLPPPPRITNFVAPPPTRPSPSSAAAAAAAAAAAKEFMERKASFELHSASEDSDDGRFTVHGRDEDDDEHEEVIEEDVVEVAAAAPVKASKGKNARVPASLEELAQVRPKRQRKKNTMEGALPSKTPAPAPAAKKKAVVEKPGAAAASPAPTRPKRTPKAKVS